jgi:general secretion pathway protein G
MMQFLRKIEINEIKTIGGWGVLRPFTLIELMLCVAILVILLSFSLKAVRNLETKAKNLRAIVEIKKIQTAIEMYIDDHGTLPSSLADLNAGALKDPWGTPYQYNNFEIAIPGKLRKDRFQHPLNSTYDLWSNGSDRQSDPPLTSTLSYDDIIRANDGEFIGLGADY